jgi:hypothetical protein
MITRETVEKYGFKKTKEDLLNQFDDYYVTSILPDLHPYLYATLHVPKEKYENLKDNYFTILIHRWFDYEMWGENPDLNEFVLKPEIPSEYIIIYRDFMTSYFGEIYDEEDFVSVLTKCGIIPRKK